MHHRWTGIERGARWRLHFQTPNGVAEFEADAVIFALGGGSWPATGSDGAWAAELVRTGIAVAPLRAANVGWELAWPAPVLAAAEGQPLKSIAVRAGDREVKGELLVTRYGLEGGAIYQLGPELRALAEPEIAIDFKPGVSAERLVAKLGPVRRNFLAEARSRWRLSDAAFAILSQQPAAAEAASAQDLAAIVKNCALRLGGPRPLAEAISSAGGVRWRELDRGLMLAKMPGVFVAGEMVDWDAPTGGYLIHGCFAMGSLAARSALDWLRRAG
jgi:hypothetical protein